MGARGWPPYVGSYNSKTVSVSENVSFALSTAMKHHIIID